jgi:hypothetical protein
MLLWGIELFLKEECSALNIKAECADRANDPIYSEK